MKILDGDRKDRINGTEPSYPKGLGDPPAWLDDLARSAWSRLVATLDASGVSTRADAEAAALYCHSYSTWRKANAAVAKDGLTVLHQLSTEDREILKPHPLIAVANEAHRQMARLLSQFGMTPSARAGLHVESKAEDDPLLAYFSGSPYGKKDGPPRG